MNDAFKRSILLSTAFVSMAFICSNSSAQVNWQIPMMIRPLQIPPPSDFLRDMQQLELLRLQSEQLRAQREFLEEQKRRNRDEQTQSDAQNAQKQSNPQDGVIESWLHSAAPRMHLYPNFESIVFAADVPISLDMVKLMTPSTYAADIAYYLATHKDESLKISQMTIVGAAKEIARIEKMLKEKDISGKEIASTKNSGESTNPNFVALAPSQIKMNGTNRDAVAIIIGIQNYRRLAKADFADQDATKFAEYANRALGIPKEKIKILIDADADQAALLKTFRNWLPLNVSKGKTEVFVFYSGHGLPSTDGKSLYFLPHGVDQDLLDETAIDQKKIIAAIQSAHPKSVTMFVDSCYSGQSRNGSQLLAGAKPVILKNSDIGYPPEFTVFTASAGDQISSANNDLQHGIFSFYLMKGMEGAADINKDGNITYGEMQQYLSENVQRQALAANRVQVPQLIGDANRLLIRQ
jgi:hypothetical protein